MESAFNQGFLSSSPPRPTSQYQKTGFEFQQKTFTSPNTDREYGSHFQARIGQIKSTLQREMNDLYSRSPARPRPNLGNQASTSRSNYHMPPSLKAGTNLQPSQFYKEQISRKDRKSHKKS